MEFNGILFELYSVYKEKNYPDRDLDSDLGRQILSRVKRDLDRHLDNFNPDIRWIAMQQSLNNEQQCDVL